MEFLVTGERRKLIICSMKRRGFFFQKQTFPSSRNPRVFCKPKFYYRFHKSPSLIPNPNPTESSTLLFLYFFKIHFNIIYYLLSTKPMISMCSLCFRFPHINRTHTHLTSYGFYFFVSKFSRFTLVNKMGKRAKIKFKL